jgi:hypothetical protein
MRRVGGDEQRLLAELRLSERAAARVAPGDRHSGAFRSQPPGDPESDARGSAGYEGDGVLEWRA